MRKMYLLSSNNTLLVDRDERGENGISFVDVLYRKTFSGQASKSTFKLQVIDSKEKSFTYCTMGHKTDRCRSLALQPEE